MRVRNKSFGIAALIACSASVFAQGGASFDPSCWPPMSTTGPSTDYLVYKLTDDVPFIAGPQTNNFLFGVTVGVGGTDTYGNLCVAPNGATFNSSGRFGFTVGSVGSIQTTADDFLRINFGMPYMVGGSIGYTMLIQQNADGTNQQKIRFGGGGIRLAFVGASDRYCITETEAGDFTIRLQTDVIGDAARMSYRLTNNATEIRRAGLWMGSEIVLTDQNGFSGIPGYVFAPGFRPFTVPKRFRRGADGTTLDAEGVQVLPMPNTMSFGINQELAYGLQVLTTPGTSNGRATSDQTPSDEIAIGNSDFGAADNGLIGNFTNNGATMPDQLISPDVIVTDWAFLQKWNPEIVAAGASRTINAYYKTTWGVADYAAPFAVVADAPPVITTAAGDANTLTPNPYTFRVYVDNTRGYSTIDREFTLTNVRVELNLPPGMSDAADASRTKITRVINQILPRNIGFVDFQVQVSDEANGILPYTVKVDSATGASKTLTGSINVATTPRLGLPATANLVGSPWTYQVTNWETILGLQVNQDFQAFTYDPAQREYVIQTGPQRGRGTWLVFGQPQGTVVLGGSPTTPADTTTGAAPQTLQSGWNLIANPYNFAVPLGQLSGISAADPGNVLTFQELVNASFVSGSLAYWDNTSPTPEYKYVSNATDLILPNKGYWLFVNTQQQLTLSFPPVFEPFLPSGAAVQSNSAKSWKLQLSARTDKMVDAQNFVGIAASAAAAEKATAYEAPIAPLDGAISLSIRQEKGGKVEKLAQSLVEKVAKQSWNVEVYTKEAGPVTVTWPNLAGVPRNVQFRITDKATGRSTNLRRASGYTFQAESRTTRQFTVEMEPGAAARPVIGMVTAVRSSKLANAPLNITYTLSSEATTTVRILSGGREISTVVRARADKTGQNSIVWNLRDGANRAVAPGPYTVEITAESADGERVRRFFPVNVTR